jgi:hypothetical protein
MPVRLVMSWVSSRSRPSTRLGVLYEGRLPGRVGGLPADGFDGGRGKRAAPAPLQPFHLLQCRAALFRFASPVSALLTPWVPPALGLATSRAAARLVERGVMTWSSRPRQQ